MEILTATIKKQVGNLHKKRSLPATSPKRKCLPVFCKPRKNEAIQELKKWMEEKSSGDVFINLKNHHHERLKKGEFTTPDELFKQPKINLPEQNDNSLQSIYNKPEFIDNVNRLMEIEHEKQRIQKLKEEAHEAPFWK